MFLFNYHPRPVRTEKYTPQETEQALKHIAPAYDHWQTLDYC